MAATRCPCIDRATFRTRRRTSVSFSTSRHSIFNLQRFYAFLLKSRFIFTFSREASRWCGLRPKIGLVAYCFAAFRDVCGNNAAAWETAKLLKSNHDAESLETFINVMEVRTMTNQILDPSDSLLSRKEAATSLSERGLTTAAQTLARKFHEGMGPLCPRLGGRAMYRKSHLDEYFGRQLSAPRTSSSQARRNIFISTDPHSAL